MKILQTLRRLFTRREAVHFIPRMPVCLELSDSDREALYGAVDEGRTDASKD